MRYLGGKKRTASLIVETIRKNTTASVWIEPFLGGGNVAVIAAEYFNELILSDANKHVMAMWQAGIEGYIPPKSISKQEYELLRSATTPTPTSGFVSLAASYNGKFWGGYGPVSGSRNYYEESRRSFLNDCKVLANANCTLLCGDYKVVDSHMFDDDEVVFYCDPPYANTTGYSMKWNAESFFTWASRHEQCFVSEYAAPSNWSPILSVKRSATVNHASSAKTNTEYLFVNDRYWSTH